MSYNISIIKKDKRGRWMEEKNKAEGKREGVWQSLEGRGRSYHTRVSGLYQARHELWLRLSRANMAATCSPLLCVCKELI